MIHRVRGLLTAIALISATSSFGTAESEMVPTFIPSTEDAMSIAVFGDSVTMATMADAKFGSPGPRYYWDFFRSVSGGLIYDATLGRLKPTPSDEEKHLRLGKQFGNMARIGLSPYLGSKPYSIPVLIKNRTGNSPAIYNGAQMAGSYHFSHLYLDKFEAFLKSGKAPDLVFVNFNGMDYMDNRGPTAYQAVVRAFYQRLAALAPNAKIIVTEIGNPIPLLTAEDRVAIANGPTGPIMCSDIYRTVKFGNDTGLYHGAPDTVIQQAEERLGAYRRVLADELTALNQDRDLYPQFTGKAYLLKASEDAQTFVDHLSADCIHPDTYVQKLIGLRLWELVQTVLDEA
jgi:hypothetical protein